MDHKSLPYELLMYIFKQLPGEQAVQAGRVCKVWRSVSLDPNVLRAVAIADRGPSAARHMWARLSVCRHPIELRASAATAGGPEWTREDVASPAPTARVLVRTLDVNASSPLAQWLLLNVEASSVATLAVRNLRLNPHPNANRGALQENVPACTFRGLSDGGYVPTLDMLAAANRFRALRSLEMHNCFAACYACSSGVGSKALRRLVLGGPDVDLIGARTLAAAQKAWPDTESLVLNLQGQAHVERQLMLVGEFWPNLRSIDVAHPIPSERAALVARILPRLTEYAFVAWSEKAAKRMAAGLASTRPELQLALPPHATAGRPEWIRISGPSGASRPFWRVTNKR
jgi:hypothetical protein